MKKFTFICFAVMAATSALSQLNNNYAYYHVTVYSGIAGDNRLLKFDTTGSDAESQKSIQLVNGEGSCYFSFDWTAAFLFPYNQLMAVPSLHLNAPPFTDYSDDFRIPGSEYVFGGYVNLPEDGVPYVFELEYYIEEAVYISPFKKAAWDYEFCRVYFGGPLTLDLLTSDVSIHNQAFPVSPTIVEVWPHAAGLARARITENSRGITWRVVLYDGQKEPCRDKQGDIIYFPVVPEWRKFAEDYE